VVSIVFIVNPTINKTPYTITISLGGLVSLFEDLYGEIHEVSVFVNDMTHMTFVDIGRETGIL